MVLSELCWQNLSVIYICTLAIIMSKILRSKVKWQNCQKNDGIRISCNYEHKFSCFMEFYSATSNNKGRSCLASLCCDLDSLWQINLTWWTCYRKYRTRIYGARLIHKGSICKGSKTLSIFNSGSKKFQKKTCRNVSYSYDTFLQV